MRHRLMLRHVRLWFRYRRVFSSGNSLPEPDNTRHDIAAVSFADQRRAMPDFISRRNIGWNLLICKEAIIIS